jgi:hypothetical protein
MDDCEVATWWPESAGERLTFEFLRRGGDEGGDARPVGLGEGERRAPLELDTEATSADARPVVLRLGDAWAVLIVELRRQSRRFRPLAVEVMLTESESRTQSGESSCDSGKPAGLLVARVNARCITLRSADVGEAWNSLTPVTDAPGPGGTMERAGLLPFFVGGCVWAWGSAT